MFTASRDRRQRDRDMRRAAANRRVGHDHAYLILFGPGAYILAGVALLAGAAVATWLFIDHELIAKVLGAAGILILAVYGAWWASGASLPARMVAASRGGDNRLPWHLTGLAGALLTIAAVLIWRQAAA